MPDTSEHARRQHYLRAMGVDRWQRRRPGAKTSVLASAGESGARAPTPAAARSVDAAAGEGCLSVASMPLAQLEATVADCRLCELHKGRNTTVFGTGAQDAACMIIGEAPGADEDACGEPFVGRAGRLLNAMLRAMGMTRESVYIANIVKCRPPKNRDPKPEEMIACAPYLRRQIAVVRPRIILAVGRVAAQHLAGSTSPIGRMRGQSYYYDNSDDGTRIPIVVTYHPAYLLRSPIEKRKSWEDLRRAQQLLKPGS